jgi:HAD superfamily hydrolase (TIGR01662 family)
MITHPITAIFFDFDGTLRHNNPPAIPFFHNLAADFGLRTNPDLQRMAERWVYAYWASSPELVKDIRNYGDWDGNDAFWKNHARRHLIELGASETMASELAPRITQKMQEVYQPVNIISEDVLPTLRTLKQAGYTVAVVSNRSKPFDEMIQKLGLEDFLDFSLAAGEVGYWKPDPRLLLEAASRADIAPDEIVYVGDNYFADVVCAREAGMMPVLMDPGRLFPDAECPVISRIGELPQVLRR